jgi:hypothetical protein
MPTSAGPDLKQRDRICGEGQALPTEAEFVIEGQEKMGRICMCRGTRFVQRDRVYSITEGQYL